MLSGPGGSAGCLAELSPRSPILYTLKSLAVFTLSLVWQLESWGSRSMSPAELLVVVFRLFPHSATHIQKLFICLCVLLAVCIARWPIFARIKCLWQQEGFIDPCWAGVLTPLWWQCSWSMTAPVLAKQTHFPPTLQKLLYQPLTSSLYSRGWAHTGVFSIKRADSKAN